MKFALLAAVLTALAAPAFATDVGVSVSVSQPGLYGRIDIGNVPQPQVIFPQPVVIQPVQTVVQPIYMHVPPGHAKNWGKHCAKYGACSRPVYFVQEDWYNTVYVPHKRVHKGGKHKHKHKGHDHDGGHDHHGHHHDHGKGSKGHGHGHGRGKD